ncbi:hypothetical protein ACIPY6_28540 [Streptomyces sp. NPDC090054]|uniref:hypothetical protein n=1 Tax=Streptomyces sp. NPDC090054 TaxID=3365933 RepID=UPI00381395E7
MTDSDDIKAAVAEALVAALNGQGPAIICYAKCDACQWGQHYDEPTPHPWAGSDDIEHAAATGQPEPTGNCGCYCAQAES